MEGAFVYSYFVDQSLGKVANVVWSRYWNRRDGRSIYAEAHMGHRL